MGVQDKPLGQQGVGQALHGRAPAGGTADSSHLGRPNDLAARGDSRNSRSGAVRSSISDSSVTTASGVPLALTRRRPSCLTEMLPPPAREYSGSEP